MKNAIIIYRSRTGITKKLGENIASFLAGKGLKTEVRSVEEADPSEAGKSDYVFLGCWTSGLYFFLQHPDKGWKRFARKLPSLDPDMTILFTTYKLSTGSMFRAMCKTLKFTKDAAGITVIRSRNGDLPEESKRLIATRLALQ